MPNVIDDTADGRPVIMDPDYYKARGLEFGEIDEAEQAARLPREVPEEDEEE